MGPTLHSIKRLRSREREQGLDAGAPAVHGRAKQRPKLGPCVFPSSPALEAVDLASHKHKAMKPEWLKCCAWPYTYCLGDLGQGSLCFLVYKMGPIVYLPQGQDSVRRWGGACLPSCRDEYLVALFILTLSAGVGGWDGVFLRSHPVGSGVPVGVIGWGSGGPGNLSSIRKLQPEK